MNPVDIAYLAGFFDGEGNVRVDKRKPTIHNLYGQYALQVTVVQSNNHRDGLLLFTQCGGRLKQRKDGAWQWQINSSKASVFLGMIYPYLRLKKQQTEKAIAFQKLIKSRGNARGRAACLSESERQQRDKAYQAFRDVFK